MKPSDNYFQSQHMGTTNKQHYGNERTAADNLKWPLLPIITQWMKTAWDYINPGIISISFKKYFISNDI